MSALRPLVTGLDRPPGPRASGDDCAGKAQGNGLALAGLGRRDLAVITSGPGPALPCGRSRKLSGLTAPGQRPELNIPRLRGLLCRLLAALPLAGSLGGRHPAEHDPADAAVRHAQGGCQRCLVSAEYQKGFRGSASGL